MLVSFFLCTYYNVINAWAFWYLFHSFQVSGRGLGQERAGSGRVPRTKQRASEPGIRGSLLFVRCVRTFLEGGPTDFIRCALKDVTTPSKILRTAACWARGKPVGRADGEGHPH